MRSSFVVVDETTSPISCSIGNVPHDWLFQHVSAVCQHGGAGTTSQALKLGRPTIVGASTLIRKVDFGH